MDEDKKYIIEPVQICAIWNDNYLFSENYTAYMKILLQDDSRRKVRINKFGWLTNYIFGNVTNFNSNDIDNDIIGNKLYIILNKDNNIECFAKNKESERVKNILFVNTLNNQNESEQSKITP